MSPRAGVRIAIVGIFAVLATVFVVSDARSQPRPGGITGMPRPGGITGMPNMPRPGGIAGIPQPPAFPQPPTFTPPTMPSIPRGPQFETVWSCGKCKAELGRGNIKPSFDSCPRCGVRFINGGGGGGFGLVNPPDLGAPAFNPPPAVAAPADPDLLPRGATGGHSNDTPAFTAPPASTSSNETATKPPGTEEKSSKTGSLILKIMIGVFGLLFLLGIIGGAFLIFSANKGSKPAKKSKRRTRDLDDDDDD